MAALRPNNQLPDYLAMPEEVACLGTPSSKVLSSKLANRPPSACSETRQPLRQLGEAEFLVTLLLAKRTRPLPLHKPAYSETRLDSRLLSRRTMLLEAESVSSAAHPHPLLVQCHPVHNPSEAPCLVAPWALLLLGVPRQARKGYRHLLRNLLRPISQFSPSSPRRAHRHWRRRPRRKSIC